MAPFLWIGFICLKAAEPLQENSLLLTTEALKTFITCCGGKSIDIVIHTQHEGNNTNEERRKKAVIQMKKKNYSVCFVINS